jgi:tRNA threonylcarbamoyladenosine biosynthesis protein TsaB
MKILAVNTANSLLTVALTDGQKLLDSFETAETRNQGNLLLGHIRAALDKAGLQFSNLDLLAVVTGPGSFTGIRIGLATMRAIAMAAKLPIAGVSSFDLFAAPDTGATNLIAIESWREELYFEGRDGKGAVVIPPTNVTPEEFAAKLTSGPYVISGDAAAKLHACVPKASVASYRASAADVARVGEKIFREKGSQRPVPYYLREADITVAKTKG